MKKILLFICFSFVCIFAYSQDERPTVYPYEQGAIYRLFPTSNKWTFLKLDTRNGKIWQVQYSINGPSYRYQTPLNEMDLNLVPADAQPGKFTLCPTQNFYNFILLDQIDGRCWQVQWSTNSDERMVLRIF